MGCSFHTTELFSINFRNLKLFPQLTFHEGKVRAIACSGFTRI